MAAYAENEILEGIRAEAEAIAPHVEQVRLEPAAHIADVGINSVQMLELVARLEERFALTLPDYELARVESVGDLARLIDRYQGEAP